MPAPPLPDAPTLPVALTIAGSDSSGGAGIQADLKSMMANGVYGASVITAITAQNTRGVTAVHELPVDVVIAQLDAVASDLSVAATKTGMLGSAALIEAIANGVERHELMPLVVDPVLISSSGRPLLPEDGFAALRDRLLPLATLLTPNAPEAARLLGRPVRTVAEAEAAAKALAALGCGAVLIKGGHLDDQKLGDGALAVDVLWDGARPTTFRQPRLATPHTHGTGCTYASAIAARLARGDGLIAAVGEARAYLQGAIAGGLAIGGGAGPTDHGWFLERGRRFADEPAGDGRPAGGG